MATALLVTRIVNGRQDGTPLVLEGDYAVLSPINEQLNNHRVMGLLTTELVALEQVADVDAGLQSIVDFFRLPIDGRRPSY